MTADDPVEQGTVRVEKGLLFVESGVFPVSRIDGTQVMDRWFRPAGPGYMFVVLGVVSLVVVLVSLPAGLATVTGRPGTAEWFGRLAAVSNFVLPFLGMAIAFFVIHVKAQPRTTYWHELEIWIGGTKIVVAAGLVDPLWAIQREIATAQRDLEYVGPLIIIGQLNQVSGNSNAANFGGQGNSARTDGV